jgi:predicted protein tyrosine phosphatase
MPVRPQHYSIEDGKLYAGEYPGSLTPEVAMSRLRCLAAMGVRTFIDLTAADDKMEPYDVLFADIGCETGVTLQRISTSIRDMSIPDGADAMREIMNIIRKSICEAPAVYIHCWGGIGRTGTVVGCWLRECVYDPESALLQVHRPYAGHMPKSWKWNSRQRSHRGGSS